MLVKIFHTADLHIGMKFNGYPEPIRSKLQEARSEVLTRMVQRANEENCDLLVIAGDLFHNIKGIDKGTIARTAEQLNGFLGECVLILPGNHDYDNDMIELWDIFKKNASDKILLLKEESTVSLADYGLNVMVYPAPCRSKHSVTNNIGWIRTEALDPVMINIGLAHGALQGISPDMERSYFYMEHKELEDLPMDLWLLGHTHVPYPDSPSVKDWRIFNPGTPEPDGLDCRHEGHAWLITLDEEKSVRGELIRTGRYRFQDLEYEAASGADLDLLRDALTGEGSLETIARIRLAGRLTEDDFIYRQEIYKKLEQELAYLLIDDSDLGIKITPEKIEQEFTRGSFPSQFLNALADDEEALQIAYELIMGVKK